MSLRDTNKANMIPTLSSVCYTEDSDPVLSQMDRESQTESYIRSLGVRLNTLQTNGTSTTRPLSYTSLWCLSLQVPRRRQDRRSTNHGLPLTHSEGWGGNSVGSTRVISSLLDRGGSERV